MTTDNELEQLLRKAPAPPAPFGLERRLTEQASRRKKEASWTWFSIFQQRSWAPALAMFVVLAGLLTALAVQQNTLTTLKQARQELAALAPAAQGQIEQEQTRGEDEELKNLQKQSVELRGLRQEMAEIENILAQQPAIAQENAALRAELSSLTQNHPELSPEFQTALAEARKKAERIKCVNNLKNVGLAARIWAADNGDKNLPIDFATMNNQLGTPKILICPSDPSRKQAINNWDEFNAVGTSYEMLSPGLATGSAAAIYVRCPFHNNVLKADGSVFQLRPDQQLVQRDGHWEIGQ
jgi:hypothetical protein